MFSVGAALVFCLSLWGRVFLHANFFVCSVVCFSISGGNQHIPAVHLSL